jgi:hypothetical protein
LDNVRIWLDKFDMKANDLQTTAILLAVKLYSLEQKRLLTESEFKVIAENVVSAKQ